MEKLTIVAPMYNEEEMIPLFFEKINEVVEKIKNYKVTILCVDDGSRDNTFELLKAQREKQGNVHVVSFSRNFGHESAVAAGLKCADGDVVVIMDADLQDPPELMLDMLKLYEEGYDVVNAKRVNRKKDPFLKRVTAEMFYSLIGKMSGKIKVPNNVGNYRLMSRRVLDHVNALIEKNHVFRVQVPYVGYKTTNVEFVRPERPKGQTHYNYGAMFKLAGDSITSSSVAPLKWGYKVGIPFATLSFLALITCIVLYFLNYSFAGIGILISVISIWSSAILIFLGILGEYIGRILIETQARPLYYIRDNLEAK